MVSMLSYFCSEPGKQKCLRWNIIRRIFLASHNKYFLTNDVYLIRMHFTRMCLLYYIFIVCKSYSIVHSRKEIISICIKLWMKYCMHFFCGEYSLKADCFVQYFTLSEEAIKWSHFLINDDHRRRIYLAESSLKSRYIQ